MKTDLYTKIVLTVIAIALVINLIKDFNLITPAHASDTSSILYQNSGTIDVNIKEVGGKQIDYSEKAVPVIIQTNRDK